MISVSVVTHSLKGKPQKHNNSNKKESSKNPQLRVRVCCRRTMLCVRFEEKRKEKKT